MRGAIQAKDETTDRDLILQHVERVNVCANELEISLRNTGSSTEPDAPTRLVIPFSPNHSLRKGIAHAPAVHQTLDPQTRDKLMEAIARALRWMDSIIVGEIASFDDIAAAQGLAERYVRPLAVLAFLSPKIVQAIAEGTAPKDWTVSRLTQALPHSWSAQEQTLSLR